jgi:hypothetical protein
MKHDLSGDFGALYRAAFAERDPQRKQVLLSQVQRLISSAGPDEALSMMALAPQSVSFVKLSSAA